ncbi:MAG: hypothetical protein GY754_47155, partial [bacterium]|nr:hypothetical protein [bacterium]
MYISIFILESEKTFSAGYKYKMHHIMKTIIVAALLPGLAFLWGCSSEGSWDLLRAQLAASSSSISVTISSSASPVALVNPIPATITFSEEISGFELSDITVGNGTAGNLTETTANKVYTIDITPIRSGSQLTVDIPANAVADLSAAAVQNTAADQFTIGYRYNALMDSFNSNVICKFDTTASGSNVSGDISNFPVLIRITDAAIIDAVKSGAPDIRFFDTDASTLNYEIEEWDQDNDTA